MSDVGDLLAGRYRLARLVGSGAMGIVWQTVDERLHRAVAVKQLLLQPGLDPARAEEARQRALREARIAARLHHPHAVAVHDVAVHNGLPVLVMEYLPSRSLADILAEAGRLDPTTVARIGSQAASALAAAHVAGIVHRDVKPGNILIAEDGTAKITDFGISHAAGDVALTQTGLLAGTPAYLAPEIARGDRPHAQLGHLLPRLHAVRRGRRYSAVRRRRRKRDRVAARGGRRRSPAGPAGTLLDAGSVPQTGYGHGLGQTGRAWTRRSRTLLLAAGLLAMVPAGGVLFASVSPETEPVPKAATPIMTAAAMEQAISEYYRLLPDRHDEAWNRLGPGLRAQNKQRYGARWDRVAGVTVVSPPRSTGEDTVHVGVELVLPDGTKIREFHQFGMVAADPRPLINTDTLLHTDHIAPPPADRQGEGKGKGEKGDGGGDRKGEEGKKGEEDKKGEEGDD